MKFWHYTGVSSFSDLISHEVHRAFLWIIGILTIVGNAAVLGGRNLAKTENRILAMFVKNLAGLWWNHPIYYSRGSILK